MMKFPKFNSVVTEEDRVFIESENVKDEFYYYLDGLIDYMRANDFARKQSIQVFRDLTRVMEKFGDEGEEH